MTRKTTQNLKTIILRHKLLTAACAIGAAMLVMLTVRLMPPSESNIRRSACMVDGVAQLCVIAGQDTIVVHTDSVRQQGVWINRHWWWPSCDGRILTVAHPPRTRLHIAGGRQVSATQLMTMVSDSLGRLVQRKEVERKELDYYLKSHGVQDEGYTRIARYAGMQRKEADSIKHIYHLLKAFMMHDSVKMAQRYVLRVTWYDNDNQPEHMKCIPWVAEMSHDDRPIIVHTLRSVKPWGVYAVRNLIWGGVGHKEIVTVTLAPEDSVVPHHAIITTGRTLRGHRHDIPSLFAIDGSPVFSKHGQFVGIISHQEIIK